ncbi:hypothetical protein STTU_0591 [Streptomyces sp. Tu6071]|nr:hypothetical protein STTU_0591 [Streptomyces sp. Tu6071]
MGQPSYELPERKRSVSPQPATRGSGALRPGHRLPWWGGWAWEAEPAGGDDGIAVALPTA